MEWTLPGPDADLQTVLTAWNAATDRLQQTHELLRQEVARLTDELEEKDRELARKNRLADLGQMASHVAHEVRNSLVPIKLYSSLLRRQLTDRPDSLDIVDQIIAAFTTLEATVGDLLHFAADRDPAWESFDLGALIEEVRASLAPQFAAQGIAWQVAVRRELPGAVVGDRGMLRRALLNLVLNAFDVMPEGGRLSVAASTEADGFTLTVSDTGPGIAAEALPRLFEPFFTTKSGGTGLGLAIVERIVHAHGGTIRAANGPGGGAEFTLRIPRFFRGEADE